MHHFNDLKNIITKTCLQFVLHIECLIICSTEKNHATCNKCLISRHTHFFSIQ